MSSKSTEKKAKSQDKTILQKFSLQDFIAICSEYDVVNNSVKDLLELAKDSRTSTKEKIDIYKWIIEMNVGKAKEQETKQEMFERPISAGIFIDSLDN